MRSATSHDKKKQLSSRRTSSLSSLNTNRNNNNSSGIHINISSDPFQHRIPPYIQRLWQESKLRKHMSVWKRRLIKKYHNSGWFESIVVCICLLVGCLFLLVHVGFFSGKKYQDWQQEHYHVAMDEVDLLDKVYPDEGRSLTTGVIILERDEQVESILSQLCQYDLFSAFILWNDDPSVNITLSDINTSNSGCIPNKITIINAPAKMGQSARYHACRQSKTPYCYFIDKPANNVKLRSIYANFLRSPHLLHGSKNNSYYNSQWKYCFVNQQVGLNTCYMQINQGTFVSKSMVANFLANYDSTSVVDDFADFYFIIYVNQLPYILQEDTISTEDILTETELEQLDLALTILYNDLEEEEGVVPLKSTSDTISFERNAKSTCLDDRCLFLTNKNQLPAVDLFHWNPTINISISLAMHQDYYTSDTLANYQYAVDNKDDTHWKSVANIHAGDYIGLDLLMPMRTSLKYRFLVRHPYSYILSLNIQISYDGLLWIKLHPSPIVHCQNIEEDEKLLECEFIVIDTGYRYIRLESSKDLAYSFIVHDFSFNAKVKKDANGQLLDITFDQVGMAFVEDYDNDDE